MPVRPDTKSAREDIVRHVRLRLDEDPLVDLDDVARELGWSRRQVQRAFKEQAGTTVQEEQLARRLDRAARSLLESRRRDRHGALVRAAQAAGYRRSRHLSAPFKRRFGVTPVEAWRAGSVMAALEYLATTPPPPSRTRPYFSWRRQWPKRMSQLEAVAKRIETDTLLGREVADALDTPRPDFRRRPAGEIKRRARPRQRSRKRRR